MMNNDDFLKLIERISENTATSDDLRIYNSWCNSFQEKGAAIPDFNEVQAKMFRNIHHQISEVRPGVKLWPRIIIAASILLAILVGINLYLRKESKSDTVVMAETILPGTDKAILTLADGTKINLSDVQNGELAKQANISIQKTEDGQLIYTTTNTHTKSKSPLYNTINTPNGGQYQLTLPDGTKVWLNAASSLRYPASFSAQPERRVELSGEAYFQVSRNKAQPFLVKTASQTVEVVGTHFNINSYADERSTVTTLEEGRVKVASGGAYLYLSPGEKTVTKNVGNIVVEKADLETEMGWKNGWLTFKDANIQTIMRQAARWYNIDIAYRGEIPQRLFNGSVSRKSTLATLLKILEQSNIKFALSEEKGKKKITISP